MPFAVRTLAFAALFATPALALPDGDGDGTPLADLQVEPVAITPADIDAATYAGAPLAEGPSPLAVTVQVLLDRAGTSPGVIDGVEGTMTRRAVMAFQRRLGVAEDGMLDAAVWDALVGESGAPIMARHVIGARDVASVGGPLPEDYAELARLDRMAFERLTEALAERFHMDEALLIRLNPGAEFVVGEEIAVVSLGPPVAGRIDRIEVSKGMGRLSAFDAEGRLVADYPVAVGSEATPSPEGTVEVLTVATDPTYHYDPSINFKQGDNDRRLILPPGPNGPVGSTWIDLSRPTYGLHGTPDPASLASEQSHGCVRLTNWDADELAHMVHHGTVVAFLE